MISLVCLLATISGAEPAPMRPMLVAFEKTTSTEADLPAIDFDTLLNGVLDDGMFANVKRAPAKQAHIVIKPGLTRTTTHIRVTFHILAANGVTDAVGFDFKTTKFGLSGVQTMLRSVFARADKARTLAEQPQGAIKPATKPEKPSAPQGAQTGQPAGVALGVSTETPLAPEESPVNNTRFRIGVSGGIGTFFPGPLLNFGGELRIGVQLNKMFAVYAAGGSAGGLWFPISIDPTARNISISTAVSGYWFAGVQGEVLLANLFFVGVGAHVASGGWTKTTQSVNAAGSVAQLLEASAGLMPAFNLKLGLAIGRPNLKTGRRHQVSVSIDTMFLLAPNATAIGQRYSNGSASAQVYNGRGFRLGIAPMLMIGYDAR